MCPLLHILLAVISSLTLPELDCCVLLSSLSLFLWFLALVIVVIVPASYACSHIVSQSQPSLIWIVEYSCCGLVVPSLPRVGLLHILVVVVVLFWVSSPRSRYRRPPSPVACCIAVVLVEYGKGRDNGCGQREQAAKAVGRVASNRRRGGGPCRNNGVGETVATPVFGWKGWVESTRSQQ